MAPPTMPGSASLDTKAQSTLPKRQCEIAGDAGREHLGGMHAGARGSRRDAEAEHHRGAGKAVGHADGTVHELGREAHGDEQNKIPQHRPPPWWQRRALL